MSGSLGFVDIFQEPALYSTRSIVTSASSGGCTVSSTLPASNVFDKSIGKVCRVAIAAPTDDLRLDIRIVRRQIAGYPFGVGVLGLINVTFKDGSGDVIVDGSGAFTVEATCNSGAFSDVSGGLGAGTQVQSVASPRNIYFLLTDPAIYASERLIGGRGDSGARAFGSYLRILFDDWSVAGTIDIGRIVLMPLFGFDVDAAAYARGSIDKTAVLESYDSTPYANRVKPYRTSSFAFNNLSGLDLVQQPTRHATKANANFYAGLSESAILVPDYIDGQTIVNDDGPIFGMLTQPLVDVLLRPGSSETTRLYQVSGAIREVLA